MRISDALARLRSGCIPARWSGICYNLKRVVYLDPASTVEYAVHTDDWLRRQFVDLGLDPDYPVVHASFSAIWAYDKQSDLWCALPDSSVEDEEYVHRRLALLETLYQRALEQGV